MSGFSVDGLEPTVRQRLKRVGLDKEARRAREEEPTVPPGLRASVTPAMVRRGLRESIARRSSAASADLKAAWARLAEIEAPGPN